MPKPFSEDLRWRIVWLYIFLHKSAIEIANFLFVSTKTVERLGKLFLTTGNVSPFARVHRGGPGKKMTDFEQLTIVNLVLCHPGIFLYELQHKIFTLTGTRIHCSTICRTLKQLGLT